MWGLVLGFKLTLTGFYILIHSLNKGPLGDKETQKSEAFKRIAFKNRLKETFISFLTG
jgi:hypothetical protein